MWCIGGIGNILRHFASRRLISSLARPTFPQGATRNASHAKDNETSPITTRLLSSRMLSLTGTLEDIAKRLFVICANISQLLHGNDDTRVHVPEGSKQGYGGRCDPNQ